MSFGFTETLSNSSLEHICRAEQLEWGMSFKIIALSLSIAMIATSAMSANTPCSGSKGGISHCKDHLFMCNDGGVSQSKKSCDGSVYGGGKGSKPSLDTEAKELGADDDDAPAGKGGRTKGRKK